MNVIFKHVYSLNIFGLKRSLELFPFAREDHANGLLLFYPVMKSTNQFYQSEAWKTCRREYYKTVGGLCEKCLANGSVTAGEIVHHKEHLDADKIKDESIALNFDNLILVCRKCHALEHPEIYGNKIKRRYAVDDNGRVVISPVAE